MFWITSVPFCRTKDSPGSEDTPSLVQVILGLRSLTATQDRWRLEPINGVTSSGGRNLKRRGENTISRAVPTAVPKMFSASQMYRPPSFLDTLEIISAPSLITVLSEGSSSAALDHVILGCGLPVAVQAIVTFCFSSAISRLDAK